MVKLNTAERYKKLKEVCEQFLIKHLTITEFTEEFHSITIDGKEPRIR